LREERPDTPGDHHQANYFTEGRGGRRERLQEKEAGLIIDMGVQEDGLI